ncbi:MAG: hypothetical protein HQ507_04405, partial [Candidatus Marinimicrobia bacterium]|nr:hypothetical protein [Candidatus Neomarinimicrobiota bacterium]
MKTNNLKCIIFGLIISLAIWGKEAQMDTNQRIIQSADLEGLPGPVKRFLENSQVVGTPYIKKARIKQTGQFKMAPDKPWTP